MGSDKANIIIGNKKDKGISSGGYFNVVARIEDTI